MSPRAACRLEQLGFGPVYDYVAGKADWLAAGQPTEGRPHPGRVLDALEGTPTCGPDEPIAEVARRTRAVGRTSCVVIGDDRIVFGRLHLDRLDTNTTSPADAVMEPGPTTIRADADLHDTLDRMRSRHVEE